MKNDVPSMAISKLCDLCYEDQILDIMLTGIEKEVSDIPLSPSLISDNGVSISLSSKVYQKYGEFIKRIGNPDTAVEILFCYWEGMLNIMNLG